MIALKQMGDKDLKDLGIPMVQLFHSHFITVFIKYFFWGRGDRGKGPLFVPQISFRSRFSLR